mgnify:FL=1|jgi:hypothetical protein
MPKYARGKKSLAISDISGLRVKYTELRTTWNGLRVSPEDYEPKHPQLTPRKNVVDATALFNARPNNDPENVEVFIGFTQDWTIDPRLLPPVGVPAIAHVGNVYLEITHTTQTGVGGTGAVGTSAAGIGTVGAAGAGAVGTSAAGIGTVGAAGTGAVGVETLEMSIDEAGVAGTGGVGDEIPAAFVTGVSGGGGAGAVGIEALSLSIDEAGVGGTGAVGAEVINLLIVETGVGGTGGVGTESVIVNQEWGSGEWGEGTWGN